MMPSKYTKRITTASSTLGDVDTFTENSGYLFELSESDAVSIVEYDIKRITSIYQKKPLIVNRRLFQIGSNFGKWFLLRYIDGLMERADTMFKIMAFELRKILVEFGPAYVKIAQVVSSIADLIPPSYLEELSVLQDRITPFSNEVAFSTIEAELGLTIDKLFSEISSKSVVATSLGQVSCCLTIGVTYMLVASKYEEISAPRVEEFCFITDNTYTKEEVVKMESEVLNFICFQLSVPSIKTFLRRFIQAAQATTEHPSVDVEYLANYLAELTLEKTHIKLPRKLSVLNQLLGAQ